MKSKIIAASFKAPAVGATAILGIMLLTFQNCSKVNFAANQVSNAEFESTSQMTINNGAKYTNTVGVKVEFSVPTAVDVYVTNDSTCLTGGNWQQIQPELPWTLGETDATATVYAKFRANGGAELPCINASIIHDDQPPTVTFTKYPTGYSKNLIETLGLDAEDNLSGVDHIECRQTGASAFTTCSATPQASSATDGAFSFQVRAVDRAGNVSSPVEKDWVFDRTPPVVTITSEPANPSASPVAQFAFTATDGDGGSGVAQLFCALDNGAPAACNNAITYSNPLLANGNHTFSIYGIDNAGNQSAPVTYNWVVNFPASGAFQVLGVTGPAGAGDQTIDAYLGTSLMPTIDWSISTGASYYNLYIYAVGTTNVICSALNIPASNTVSPTYSFGSNCVLTDSTQYDIGVTAYTTNKTATQAPIFRFTVDDTPPLVTFGTVVTSADQKTVDLPFTITDKVSGVQKATCTLLNQKDQSTQTFDCTGATTHEFTNLVDGAHTFTVVATDFASNVSTTTDAFTTLLIVCDPLNGVSTNCQQGLQSNLYYLTATQRQTLPYAHVDDYINGGTLANTLIYMSQIFVPTRSFETGFNAADGSFVTDNSGNKLVEYFALDLRTFYKLAPTETAGYYEFGIISDDGAVIQTMNSSGAWVDYINNDGYNSSKFGCDTTGMYLTPTSAVPLRIKYFQGPRTEIALTLMVRKLPAAPTTANLADPDCGMSGSSYYFGPNFNDFTTAYHYGQLLSRGWYVPAPANFELSTPSH